MRVFQWLLDLRHPICGLLAVAGIVWIFYPHSIQLAATPKPAQTSAVGALAEPIPNNATPDPTVQQESTTAGGDDRFAFRYSEMQFAALNKLYDDPAVKKAEDLRSAVDSIQHTPTGQIQLGEEFFERLLKVVNSLQKLHDDVDFAMKSHLGTTRPHYDYVTAQIRQYESDWPTLAEWWNRTGANLPYPFRTEWLPAKQRFEALSKMAGRRTDRDNEELTAVVLKCGRDWLRIPYDDATKRFNLDAPLPKDAPETAIRNYKRMYKALTTRDWDAPPRPLYTDTDYSGNPSPQEGGPIRPRPKQK